MSTKGPTYAFFVNPFDQMIDCFPDSDSTQRVHRYLAAERLSNFHDKELAQATKLINTILDGVVKRNKDPKRKLAILLLPEGQFLAWSRYGGVSARSEEAEIYKALGIKKPRR
jgi:hypothetical protein